MKLMAAIIVGVVVLLVAFLFGTAAAGIYAVVAHFTGDSFTAVCAPYLVFIFAVIVVGAYVGMKAK